MAQQSSRLNPLLTLLDTGSTQATRFTAARQIGDIAKSHPQDLSSLLSKVSQYLRSKNWDTRVAAAHATGAIAGNVKHTTLTELYSCVETKMSEAGISGIVEDVVAWPNFDSKIVVSSSFRSFDINKVLEFGALLASWGQEYDIASDNMKNPRERLARQKQNLRRRLAISDPIPDEYNFEHDGDGGWPFHNFVEQLIVDMFDPVWEVRHGSVMARREILTHHGACAGVYMLDLSSDDSFSETKDKGLEVTVKREREIDLNMQVPADEIEPNLKRPKVEDSSSPLTVTSTIISASGDDKFDAYVKVEDSERNLAAAPTNGELNFSSVKIEPQSCIDGHEDPDMAEAKGSCEDNCSMGKMNTLKSLPENCVLMNSVKVTRHSWLKNCEFLQDSVIRFLCVLSLDRFGDYVSDQVVAPIRETCAQALGAVLKCMHSSLIHETLNILLQMQTRMGSSTWESFGYQIFGCCATGDAR